MFEVKYKGGVRVDYNNLTKGKTYTVYAVDSETSYTRFLLLNDGDTFEWFTMNVFGGSSV
jgi:hypothetical protein